MDIGTILGLVSMIFSFFAFPAMWAVHKNRTQAIIVEERPEILSAAEAATLKHIEIAVDKIKISVDNEARARKSAIEEERERARELFAAKHEMSEMRGLVNQLVQNTTKLDEKLDRMHELLLQLAKSR